MPLNMNGLVGRMLRVPALKKHPKDILVVYSQLDSLENYLTLVEQLRKFGNVTVPDLPGFGGMSSLFAIDEIPSLNELADYLASFVKLMYKRRRVTFVGIGYGFVIATRMLQRYPDLAKKIDLVISLGGWAHADDLLFGPFERFVYGAVAWIGSRKYLGYICSYTVFTPIMLSIGYIIFKRYLDKQTYNVQFPQTYNHFKMLLKQSDLRTIFMGIHETLRLDNCNSRLNLELRHVSFVRDKKFSNELVEQHLKVIYSKVFIYENNTRKVSQLSPDYDGYDINLPTSVKRLLARS